MRRISLLINIFTVAVLVVAAVVIGLLYRTALNQQAALLAEIADSQARTIEGVARHEERVGRFVPDSIDHDDEFAATLDQVRDVNSRFGGFGHTGEFALARRESDSIIYLLSQRHPGPNRTQAIPFNGTRGEPMRRALSGHTGTVIGRDYRGVTVVAAYAPVNAFGMGVVAKIDLAEVQAPFVRAGLIGIVVALLTVLLGSLLFYRITNPVLRQLQESESRQRNAQQLAHLGSWTLDLAKNELTWSDEVYRIFGLRPQEFGATYEAFLAAVHPDDRAAVDAAYSDSVRDNRDGYKIEHRVVRKDTGEVRIVEEKCEHVRNASGRIVRSTGMVHDVTERKRAEEALRLSEQKFAISFAGNPAAVALSRLEDGLFLDVNDAWVTLTGFSREEAIGHSARKMRIWANAESASRFVDGLKATGTLRGREQEFQKKSGEVYVAQLSAQLLTIQGEKVILSTLVDITARKRTEEALRESEERFRAVASNTPDHVLVQNRELRYELVVNPQLGLTEQDMLGKTDYDFLSESDAARLTAMKRQVMQTGQPLHVEAPLTSAKGELGFFDGTYVPRLDPQGRSNGVIGYFRNVTERKRAEESLRRSEATLRGILDATRESIWLFSIKGTVLQANAIALKRFGKTGPDVVGKSFEEILPPELARLRRTHLLAVVESARPVEFEDERAGIQFRHSFYPVLDAEGHVAAVASYSRDITESRRAEQALRESESKLRIVADNTYDFEFWLGPNGRYLYVSPSCERVTGYKPAEFLADPELRFRISHPEDRQILMDHSESAEREKPGVLDYRIIHRDGSVRWIAHVCQPIFDSDGRFLGTRGSNRDITERKLNEARVARLAALYAVLSRVNETIVRTHDAGRLYSEVCRIVSEEGKFPLAWIGLVDGRRVVPVASGGTARDYLKEIRVETDGELGKGPTGVSIREDRAVVNDDFDSNPITAPWREPARRYGFRASASFPIHQKGKVIGTFTLYASEPGVFDEEQVQLFRALSADVSYALDAIDQERLRAEAEEALREAKETLEVRVKERTAELTAEIEERKRAEERLTAASQYARSLLESSLDPLVTINADGRITDVNEATVKVTGATRVELIGTDFSEYFTEPERARNGYRQVFAKGLVTDYPLTIRHRDGRLTDVLYNASVYKDTRGNVIGVFAAARDVTARKQAEDELQKAHDTLEVRVAERTAELKRSNEELEQFAYVASHDLQQPLRMVASYVELLGQRYKGRLDEKADKYIAYASGGAIRMHQLVNDLLTFSRVGAKAAPFASVNLSRVVAQARENLTVAIEQSGAVVEVGPLPVVSGDEIQLVQLFQNLLDNAIKFRGAMPSKVSIACRDAGNEWEFAVRDNGIGIDPKHAERIFGVFKRLHTEQEYPGTGIGLALCRKIVGRHGGRIHVEPAKGGGSAFLFTLPKQPAASSDKPAGATT